MRPGRKTGTRRAARGERAAMAQVGCGEGRQAGGGGRLAAKLAAVIVAATVAVEDIL
jgi:hypothetical protein